ncbi:MAG: hypothetical protein KDD61_03950, partial [Bdellovibrionales bacterium]|nr:hypothetical protein [Bdellovibrionales bacterium]
MSRFFIFNPLLNGSSQQIRFDTNTHSTMQFWYRLAEAEAKSGRERIELRELKRSGVPPVEDTSRQLCIPCTMAVSQRCRFCAPEGLGQGDASDLPIPRGPLSDLCIENIRKKP